MAKLSFEEWKLRKEYEQYLAEADEAPAAEPERPSEPEPAPEAPAAPEMGPAEDYRKELNQIREEMARMAKALSPSLGDVQPVGIEDVVTNFFKEA